MVEADQGASWIAALSTGQNITVLIPDPITGPKYVTRPVNNITGGFISTYTSWGPTFEVEMKPQVASPGGVCPYFPCCRAPSLVFENVAKP